MGRPATRLETMALLLLENVESRVRTGGSEIMCSPGNESSTNFGTFVLKLYWEIALGVNCVSTYAELPVSMLK